MKTLTGAHSGAIARGCHHRTRLPRHLDGRQRLVHGEGGARRRRQRTAGEAREQHQHASRSSSAAAPTCRTTCTRRRTASPAAAPRPSAPTAPSATSRARPPGRKAVTLDSTGNYVEFTTRATTNTLVTRFSIPDSAGGGGIDSTLNVYVDGTFLQGDRPHLEVRLAVRRTRPAPATRRARARPGTSTTRRTSCWARPSRRAARSGCRRTRPTPAPTRSTSSDLEQVAPEGQPGPGRVHRARRLHPPGRAERPGQGPDGHHRQPRGRLPAGR